MDIILCKYILTFLFIKYLRVECLVNIICVHLVSLQIAKLTSKSAVQFYIPICSVLSVSVARYTNTLTILFFFLLFFFIVYFLLYCFPLPFILSYPLPTLPSPHPAITALLSLSMSPFSFVLDPFTPTHPPSQICQPALCLGVCFYFAC